MQRRKNIPIKKAPAYLEELFGTEVCEKTLRNWWASRPEYKPIFKKMGGKVYVNIDKFEEIIVEGGD